MSETQGSGINHKLHFFISGFYFKSWANFGGEVPCKTHSEHRRGTLEQGSKAPNAHIGPCNELVTVPCLCPYAAGTGSSTLPMTLEGLKRSGMLQNYLCWWDQINIEKKQTNKQTIISARL